MKYLLLVEFLCEIYRREPKVRIFLNDQLLDEYNIQQNNGINHDENLSYTKTLENLEEYGIKNPKILELNFETVPAEVTLRIEICNDDNNNTNGFMTRYTQIKLKHFYLLPLHEELLLRLKKIRHSKMCSEKYPWWVSHAYDIMDLRGHTSWKDNVNTKEKISGVSLGRSGTFLCKLRKKYGFLLPEKISPTYIFNYDPIFLALHFINKNKI